MKYATIRNSNINMSKVSFGCANFGGIGSDTNLIGKGDSEKVSHYMLDTAVAAGINYFDTATTYGAGESERILGNWLKKSGIPRDRIIISTKISSRTSRLPWRRGLSKNHIQKQLELSLKRLQLDYLDLLYIHAPDPKTPLEETLGTLNAAVTQGKIMKLGASNVNTDYLKQTIMVSKSNNLCEIEVVQNSYNFLTRKDEHELIPFCHEKQIVYVGYGPLSGGLLTGKYQKGYDFPENTRLSLRGSLYRSILTDQTFTNIAKLNLFAQSKNIALPCLMYAWLYEKSPLDVFLIGSRNKSQFDAVLNALSVQLSDADWQELDNILCTRFIPK